MTKTGKTITKTSAENIILRIWCNKSLGNIAGIITPSHDFINFLYNLGMNREISIVEFIPPVNAPSCCNSNEDVEEKDKITYFGPFDEERGTVSLINAYFKLVKSWDLNVMLNLLIREDGYPFFSSIAKKMKERNVMVKTRFDNKRMLFNELCNSKLIVLPYRVIPSTIPISYLEALFLDKPLVIATSIPGFREHVHSYLNKTLPGTYRYDALAEYIAFLLSSTKNMKYLKMKQSNYTRSLKDRIQRQSILLSE
ncbi:MAG: glycosyltransferase [Candidatus Methanomethylicia archaeon]